MFEKTLTDVVKGIRASKRDTALYISQCIAEIKTEINSSDMHSKANALQKLTFLHMMGYGMSWASFATIEVMSSPRFAHKRIGYLAASQGFTQDTDVILLTTNLLKKTLRSASGGASMNGVYETGLAINCVSNIITKELAQDLLPELTDLTSHPQAYLRKKALLCLFKLFIKYPQGLRLTFARIQQCLEDQNQSVVSCAVNVITELSDTNPRNYLHLAPAFFELLTKSSNNWMLIKVVKLLGSLVPEEPRLARKLLEPLANIVRNTPAKSLLYEAAHTITLCLPYCRKSDGSMPSNVPDIVTLCAKTLKDFVSDNDQNLKYLGLVGFSTLMQSHPKVLSAADYRPLILTCLSDADVTIRTRALGLLPGMASRKNVMDLVSQLIPHVGLATGSYKLELGARIVEMCSSDKYALIQDFDWYIDVLFELCHMRGLESHGDLLRAQVQDVALRVMPVRAYVLQKSMENLLEGDRSNSDHGETNNNNVDNGRGRRIMTEILPALAWIIGEYSDLIPQAIGLDSGAVYIFDDDSEGPYHSIIQAVTAPSNSSKFPPATQQIFVQSSMKIFAAATENMQMSDDELEACARTLSANLPAYARSTNVEVLERASTLHTFLRALNLAAFPSDKIPGLVKADSDDDDSEDGKDDGKDDGNLLGMMNNASNAIMTKSKSSGLNGQQAPSAGLADRCRAASQALNAILKPSPMKPVGGKAQKKKYQNPIGFDRSELDAPVDESIFAGLVEAEKATPLPSMESINFTNKPTFQSANNHMANKPISMDSVSSPANQHGFSDAPRSSNSQGLVGNLLSTGQSPVSFQASGTSEPVVERRAANAPASAADPFYLNSGPSMEEFIGKPAAGPSQFGAIALGDMDSEDDEDENSNHNKKQKKRKKKKKDRKQSDNLVAPMLDMSFENGQAAASSMAVYDSDDDDEEQHSNKKPPAFRYGNRKAGKGNEFSSLAGVDLTTPLREDEVMPERKHREVPVKSMESVAAAAHESKKKKKKESKKAKKSSKKKDKSGGSIPSASQGTGDLLDLGGFTAAQPPTPNFPETNFSQTPDAAISKPMPAMPMRSSTNPINDAFDDLLGFSTPAGLTPLNSMLTLPAPAQPTVTAPSVQSRTAPVQLPWMRATIKTSNASGSPVVDWAKVLLLYQVSKTDSNGRPSVSVNLQVQNFMESSSMNDLKLKFKSSEEVGFGTVVAGSSASSANARPFAYDSPISSMEVKGSLFVAGCSVPVKLSLPACAHLNPVGGLALEDVANQLASSQWTSNSTKIDLSNGTPVEMIKPVLCAFLGSEEVQPGSSGASAGTFAASSVLGDQVRVLVKVKKDSVKVDIKCTNPALGKSLVSDLKKLIL